MKTSWTGWFRTVFLSTPARFALESLVAHHYFVGVWFVEDRYPCWGGFKCFETQRRTTFSSSLFGGGPPETLVESRYLRRGLASGFDLCHLVQRQHCGIKGKCVLGVSFRRGGCQSSPVLNPAIMLSSCWPGALNSTLSRLTCNPTKLSSLAESPCVGRSFFWVPSSFAGKRASSSLQNQAGSCVA